MEAKENELNNNTNWLDIIELIKKDEFSEKYKDYSVSKMEEGYLIEKKDSPIIFLFDQKKRIKVYFDDNYFEEIDVFTNLDIERYIEGKGKNIEHLFIKGEENMQYLTVVETLGACLIESDLEIREKKPLPDLNLKNALSLEENYAPNQYSKYFYEYFIYEDKEQGENAFIYDNNEVRAIIFKNIAIILRNYEEIKKFKFTGPSSIGKSLTLLRISRICYNIAYINLKVLDKYKNDLNMSYSIIISELERFSIEKFLSPLKILIDDDYKSDKSYLDLLLDIMDFLSKINQNPNFIFILDQFKTKYIKAGFIEAIEKFDKIKIVICSSINNKDIRDECLKAWLLKGKKIMRLDKTNQDYYFYIEHIYKGKNINKNISKIFSVFNYMPKYINKYKKFIDKYSIFKDAKSYIVNKISEFCGSNNLEKTLLFSNLRYIINKKYFYNDFEKIIRICPLKYFIVNFYEYEFAIKPLFPFMNYVINYEIGETECFNYFKNETYKKDLIRNKLVKGEYFEAAVKYALTNIKFPENKDYKCLIVDEIASMNKIISDKNNYFEENDDNTNIEEITENNANNLMSENAEPINNILKNKNNKEEDDDNDDNKEEKFEPINIIDNINDNNEDLDLEEDIIYQDNEEKIDLIVEKEKDEESQKTFTNARFEKLLKKFGVKEKKSFDETGLSEFAILYSKTIDDYRIDEIQKQRKKQQIFEENDINGNESIFLDQLSKYGKTLDYAYLYGKKGNKKFIGFQMKCYFENSDLDDKFCKKYEIKKSIQKILVNSMKLLNCKITEWYYYLIFYFNPKYKNENISIKNINKCEFNKIAYIFYDPIKQKFYKRKERRLFAIKELILTDNANLDYNVMDLDKFEFLLPKIKEEAMEEVKIKAQVQKDSFIKDLSKTLEIGKGKPDIKEILSEIKTRINLKDCEIYFNAKRSFNKYLIAPKTDSYISLYKMKEQNGFIDFIAIMLENGVPKSYKISTGEAVNNIYDYLNEHADYYYSLYRFLKKKPHKRKNLYD